MVQRLTRAQSVSRNDEIMRELRKDNAPGPSHEAVAIPAAPVWVLDDPRIGTASQAIGIAERLGVPFRRVPMGWSWMAHVAGFAPGGSLLGLSPATRLIAGRPGADDALGPKLVISAGRRSAAVALWLKRQFGCRLVHCMSPGIAGMLGGTSAFDMLIIPEHDRPGAADNVFPVLGAPHRATPLMLRQAALAWHDRLDHMPRPRVALLVGGPVRGTDMQPQMAHALGRRVARLATARGGSVLATTSRRTGREATEALAAGLSSALHLLYRWGEPGENPYHGFIASADTIVVTADSVSMISEACATDAGVYVALPELAGRRNSGLTSSLVEAGQVRAFGNSIAPWPRLPIDEAGRVAAEIIRRFPLD
jgi:mitochondrial fission protein ELM1